LPPARVREGARQKRNRGPPPPPRLRELPLLGNFTALAGLGTLYVRTHVGVEAACALLLAGLLSLCALGCVVSAFCDYSLCCFFRGAKKRPVRLP
jgi:hypothetical protein